MNPNTYNKPTLGGTIPFAALSQQPLGVACNDMSGKDASFKNLIRQDMLRIFSYDPHSGALKWKKRSVHDFANAGVMEHFNATRAGFEAGARQFERNGDRAGMRVAVYGIWYAVHRIIWIMQNGDIPDGVTVDHHDGDPWNNKLSNLRIATPSQNAMNRKRMATNTTGLRGIDHCSDKYRARIIVSGRLIRLGLYSTKGLAALAYAKGSLRHHGKFSPFYRPQKRVSS